MVTVIVGGLYGDEGKGKVVHHLSKEREYDHVFRVNASTNASHCVQLEGHEGIQVTKQLPSIFYPTKTKLVVATGALLNLVSLAEELQQRVDIDHLRGKVCVASNISLILGPYITANQKSAHKKIVGTTNQGTGIGTMSRVMRHGLHLYDVANHLKGVVKKEVLLAQMTNTCKEVGLEVVQEDIEKEFKALMDAYMCIEQLVGEFCIDYTEYISKLDIEKSKILIEGCNGVLLDNLHGVHPYTTSISTSINALLNGANISPKFLDEMYVVVTGYMCCLNKRPFLTEMDAESATEIYKRNPEIDPAESMQRRVGWLDLPALRKALVGHQGAKLIVNKLDVLAYEYIKVCTHYHLKDGRLVDYLPDNTLDIETAEPVYVMLDGWEDITDLTDYAKAPEALKRYIDFICDATGFEVALIGTGPATMLEVPK